MSGWVLLVKELHRRGPLRSHQFESLTRGDSLAPVTMHLARAAALGLVATPGKKGKGRPPYTLTDLGVEFCEGRMECYVPAMGRGENGGRARGSTTRLRSTWLASLPRANEVRMSHPDNTKNVGAP